MKKLVVLGLLFHSLPSFALSPTDFFCTEMPLPAYNSPQTPQGVIPPVVYGTQVKSCPNGKGGIETRTEDVCAVSALCTYVTPGQRKKIVTVNGKSLPFSELSEKEKADYLLAHKAEVEFFSSNLICPKTSGPCPTPDKCNGDLLYSISAGRFDTDELDARKSRIKDNASPLFPHHTKDSAGTI